MPVALPNGYMILSKHFINLCPIMFNKHNFMTFYHICGPLLHCLNIIFKGAATVYTNTRSCPPGFSKHTFQ